MALKTINLDTWKFALGESAECLLNAKEVTVPHTWNIEEGTEDFFGIGWYRCAFIPEKEWEDKRIRVLFHSAYHDAVVYLNGEEIGSHLGSGYTPFTVELTGKLVPGKENRLDVKVDNRFSEEMLPYKDSFDWSNDGGLIRPVEMLISGAAVLVNPVIKAEPVIVAEGIRQDEGLAVFGFDAVMDGSLKEEAVLEWTLYEGCDGTLTKVKCGKEAVSKNRVSVPGQVLENVKYWHFDRTQLYTLSAELKCKDTVVDCLERTFGFRDFHVRGRHIYLNGEDIRLVGTEWMPGSDPAYGSAETREQLEKMLACLKGTNSVMTRFHWQQDDWVYDWCDRHGMLVQEEVPTWGANPPVAGEKQKAIFRMQMTEMINAHRHHPSIIAWGVGNEMDSIADGTLDYIKHGIAFVHEMDPTRTANYVSNHFYLDPSRDGTREGEIMMVNEYIGTWQQGIDPIETWNALVKHNPDKPMVPSEYGLCEPAHKGGDVRRGEIFEEKMKYFRTYENIVGTVYFCLNDYRTQMGEEGEGKMRRRVHGSTDLCGVPKPSYWIVKDYYNPLEVEIRGEILTLTCKNNLPAYTVKGYTLILKEGEKRELPELKPGESISMQVAAGTVRTDVHIFRPNGEEV